MNHLCPSSSYSLAGPAAVERPRRRRVRAHVGAALLLGHAHATERPGLVGRRLQLAVVGERHEPRLPLGRELGLSSQRRDHRVGHRQRAADPRLCLRGDEHRGPGDMGAGLGLAPGKRVHPEGDAAAEQLVPGGVELDLVDAVAEAVVCAQLRRVLIRLGAPANRPRRARQRAGLAGAVARPVTALASQSLDQDRVGLERVVALERLGLVGDRVGLRRRADDGSHRRDCLTPAAARCWSRLARRGCPRSARARPPSQRGSGWCRRAARPRRLRRSAGRSRCSPR